MTKKIAVILAGCGRWDGSEIHESVLTLLSITQNGGSYQCFSLDKDQYQVMNHLSEKPVPQEKRNMLIESARIARGDVKSISELNVNNFDALIIPGGNGTAFNLFSLAYKGNDYSVDESVKNLCLNFTQLKKPIGFICIAPAMIPIIYGSSVSFTIGDDQGLIDLLETKGAKHFKHNVNEIHIDNTNKVVSTPAYMLAQNIGEAYTGIKKLVDQIFLFLK
jgi:enhancing lycopene biosynthesis protein 2